MFDIQNINNIAAFTTKVIWYIWIISSSITCFYTVILFIYSSMSEDYWATASDEEVIHKLYLFLINFYENNNKNLLKYSLENNKESIFQHINMLNYEDYKVYYVYLLTNGLRKRVEYMKEQNDLEISIIRKL